MSKTVFITGSSGGLGKGTAKYFAVPLPSPPLDPVMKTVLLMSDLRCECYE